MHSKSRLSHSISFAGVMSLSGNNLFIEKIIKKMHTLWMWAYEVRVLNDHYYVEVMLAAWLWFHCQSLSTTNLNCMTTRQTNTNQLQNRDKNIAVGLYVSYAGQKLKYDILQELVRLYNVMYKVRYVNCFMMCKVSYVNCFMMCKVRYVNCSTHIDVNIWRCEIH